MSRPFTVTFCPAEPRNIVGSAKRNYREFIVGRRSEQMGYAANGFLENPPVEEVYRQSVDEYKMILNLRKSENQR